MSPSFLIGLRTKDKTLDAAKCQVKRLFLAKWSLLVVPNHCPMTATESIEQIYSVLQGVPCIKIVDESVAKTIELVKSCAGLAFYDSECNRPLH